MKKPHLEQAYGYWKELLKPTDTVIDATCGNGHDTLRLAELVPEGHVYAIDVQEDAIANSRLRVSYPHVTYLHQSHTVLPKTSFKLIVYNLGYLPGGNKHLTTQSDTTLQSVQLAQEQLEVGGALSITCYPRHAEGEIEEKSLQRWFGQLDPQSWKVVYNFWKDKCPTLFFIYKFKN